MMLRVSFGVAHANAATPTPQLRPYPAQFFRKPVRHLSRYHAVGEKLATSSSTVV